MQGGLVILEELVSGEAWSGGKALADMGALISQGGLVSTDA